MNVSGKQRTDELRELSRTMQNKLDEILAFDSKLSRFDKRTLKLFITLTANHEKFEEIIKLMEKLERHCFNHSTLSKVETDRQENQQT